MLVGSECTSAQEQSSVRTLCCCWATGEAEGALMTWWRCVFSSVTSTKGACRVWVESKQDKKKQSPKMHSCPYMQQCCPQVFVWVLISLNMACITNLMMLSGNGWLGTCRVKWHQLMPDKTEWYKASTFMYKIIDCLLVKINISYMNITPPPNFVRWKLNEKLRRQQ